ncbi:hypothetical protein L6472_06275 [Prevotella sp. E13-17]|uniref:hypothetical protein n=1 Tax=Prevotella sp. E13-17 TaxID=2913616 RepID=UPI001EDB03F2|nr:hypothetical protein [Prevotella sp. E13-17]UKK52184.1 hypothetical protein L6472_06275 [Prevotella sp. E13-17]
MSDVMIGRPFAMPMIKSFVPVVLRPWIYLLFAVVFQMVNTTYMGTMQQMMGDMSLMREDVTFIFLCGVIGVAMPFPILFRLKFRFTNRSLLLFSVSGMVVCVLLSLCIEWVPALCVLSYVCCFLKLMATFECFSNIQLWMTPRRDFRIFFPLLYIVVLGDMSVSGWLSQQLSYYCDNYHAMQYMIVTVLLLILLYVYTCTQHFRFMRPLPFRSIDWLGLLLWSALLLEVIWLFTYGEYYNWSDSQLWCGVACAVPVTTVFAWGRMTHIHHPYIDPKAFRYKTLFVILFFFVVEEWMNSTHNSLESVFTGAVMHYGMLVSSRFNVLAWVGAVSGCLFCLWWMKMLRLRYTSLLTIGFALMLSYQVLMYFYIMPELNIERLYLPTFLRNFGYAIFFCTLTVYLQDLMPFQHFFMGLTIAGFIRNGVVDSISGSTYSYLLRYHVADNMARALQPIDVPQSMMMAVKYLYGATCLVGSLFLLLLMLWHVQPVRSTLKHIPYWNKIGKEIRKEMGASEKS